MLMSIRAAALAVASLCAVPAIGQAVKKPTVASVNADLQATKADLATVQAQVDAIRAQLAPAPTPSPTPSPSPTPTPTPTSTGWVACGGEGTACQLPSGVTRVRYGAGSAWVEKTFPAGARVSCSNDVFGDPISGVVKACERALGTPVASVGRDPAIGMNLDGGAMAYWTQNYAFLDRMRTASPWGAKGFDWSNLPASALTLNPTTGEVQSFDPKKVQFLNVVIQAERPGEIAARRYRFTWDGKGRIAIGNGEGANPVATSNSLTVDFTGKSTMTLDAWITDLTDPMRNIRMVRADEATLLDAGQIMEPAWLAKEKPWSVLRFMDWGHTNGSPVQHWADRQQPGRVSLLDGGASIELMVDVANAVGADMWFNIPAMADDDFVRRALTLIRDRLNPALKLHLEYSNEVWNGGFQQFAYANEQGKKLAKPGGLQWMGYRAAQISLIARPIVGDRLRMVIAPQAYWPGAEAQIFEGARLIGDPAQLFQEYAIAPYFGLCMQGDSDADRAIILAWARGGAAGLDAALKAVATCEGLTSKTGSLEHVSSTVEYHAQVAASMGMDLVAYEGGSHLSGLGFADADRPAFVDLITRMNADPRMKQTYRLYLSTFAAAGGKLFVQFNDIGTTSQWGAWAALNSTYDATSPRWDALLDAQRSAAK